MNRRRDLLLPVRTVIAWLLVAVSSAPLAATARDTPSAATVTPVVAAASDLQFALDEIVVRFEQDTGLAPRVTYGSSGNLARQIEQGAPFELFLSADEAFVSRLAARRLTRGRGDLYAHGRIVLFAPNGSPLELDPALDGLARRLASGQSGRLAVANPEHAPDGRAAEQALRARGLWQA
ncbi:MAG: molybdate ABC transporter substrate-binding protein, partial [Steroidobacteraceae bacterium]|nr:molybdate ABC transporter substrate-binding protein [Steroidobacteraceae bacterium]